MNVTSTKKEKTEKKNQIISDSVLLASIHDLQSVAEQCGGRFRRICCLLVVSSVQIIFSVMCIFMYIQEWRKKIKDDK